MNSEIVPFSFNGAEVRTETVDGEPWFVVADVANVLNLANPSRVAASLEEDDLRTTEVIDSLGRKQLAYVTTEAGVYQIVFQSRKPEASVFRKWVTREVIPTIRKTGSYSVAPVAAPAELSRLEILTMALDSERRAITAETAVVEMTPKAEAWDDFIGSEGLILIGVAAKQAGYGQNKAYRMLRAGNILRPDNVPYASFERYFELTFHAYEDSTGRERIKSTTKLTAGSLPWFSSTLDRLA